MQKKEQQLSSLAPGDDSLPETNFFSDEHFQENIQFDESNLYTIPFRYLCTVHSKLYNNSALSLLCTVFNV